MEFTSALKSMDRDESVITPAIHTMWRWSRQQDWLARAAVYDDQVVVGAMKHLAVDDSIDLADRARLFQAITRQGVEITLVALQRLNKHLKDNPSERMPVSAIASLVSLSVAASKRGELLDGRPTDRDADSTKGDWEKKRREIMADLESRLSNGWGPPAGTTVQ